MKTIIRSLPSRKRFLRGKDSLAIGYPWLTPGAIMALEQVVLPDFRVLELGCGGSTVFWARHDCIVKSFETSLQWAELTRETVADYSRVTIEYGDLDQLAISVQSEPDASYDIVLVDHKDYSRVHTNRLPLALLVSPKVKIGGWFVVDNYAKYGMDRFQYFSQMWDVYTFDDLDWQGGGTRLCKRIR